jgi:SdrD B-like domain/Domain of unknown function DUF11
MRTTVPLNRNRRALRAALLVLALSGVVAALTPTGRAFAKPRRPDIAITGITVSPAEVIMGDLVDIRVEVANVGAAPSDPVIVSVTLPATLRKLSDNASSRTWDCFFIAPSWTCSHAGLVPGEVAETLNLPAEVVGGAPGDVLVVTATATTTSRELSTANNTGQASAKFITAGTVRGKVWLDEDRDGQRDPGETALSSVAYGFWFLRIETPDGIQSIQAVVDADGTYAVALKPNQYLVQVGVYPAQWGYTTPDVGDDATDSDVTPYFVDEVNALARSDVAVVTAGGEVVIDVGLTYAAAG